MTHGTKLDPIYTGKQTQAQANYRIVCNYQQLQHHLTVLSERNTET